ncbi:MAG: DUF1573 domain-containing protein [Planctomycetaceae bacterium]|nr:DUF1573 domain-containing protein [Planctomycetaceae bacterium]
MIAYIIGGFFYFATLDLEKHDVYFGVVPPDTKIVQSVKFSNNGNKTLIIDKVIVGCGCTEVKLSNRNVKPGDTGNVEITLTGKSLPGNDHADIHFFSNDSRFPVRGLTVHYTSVSNFFFNPKQLDFGLIQKEDLPIEKKINIIEQHSNIPLVNQNWSVLLEANFLTASILQNQDLTRYISVGVSAQIPLGTFFESLKVIDEDTQNSYFANVVGVVYGNVYSTPSVLDFGKVIVEQEFFNSNEHKETIAVLSRKSETRVNIQKIVVCESLRDVVNYQCVEGSNEKVVFSLSHKSFSSDFADKEMRGRVTVFCSDSEGEDFILNIPLRIVAQKFRR